MTARLFDDVTLELPDGWELAESPTPGTLIHALAPATDEFRSNLTVEVYPRQDNGEGDASIDDFHEQQLTSLARTMTDALLVDDAPVEIGGYPARHAVIAFRQGYWTVTALVWTIQAPGAAVVLACMSDTDQLPVDVPLFRAVAESVRFAGGA